MDKQWMEENSITLVHGQWNGLVIITSSYAVVRFIYPTLKFKITTYYFKNCDKYLILLAAHLPVGIIMLQQFSHMGTR